MLPMTANPPDWWPHRNFSVTIASRRAATEECPMGLWRPLGDPPRSSRAAPATPPLQTHSDPTRDPF